MTSTRTKAAGLRGHAVRSPWFHAALALVLVALIQGFFVKVYQVPSGSMEQTLNVNDRVLVNRLANAVSNPGVGDVVVFRKPLSWGPQVSRAPLRTAVGWFGELTGIGPGNTEYLVKRVVGVPGTRVSCCDAAGSVLVDGSPLDEPYVFQNFLYEPGSIDCSATVHSPRCFPEIRLGEKEYLVLGDHRSDSSDSAAACRSQGATEDCFRLVDRSDLIGSVDWFIFPFNKWGDEGLKETSGASDDK